MSFQNPDHNCKKCERLCGFRAENRVKFPDKHNAPVPSFGDLKSRLLIVGLAPGLRGANFSGRPFTGDYAGDLLYSTLLRFGHARGTYAAHKDDGIELIDVRITNAVRCVPPQNKPTPDEIKICRDYLVREIGAMPNLKVILTLGLISHDSVLRTLGLKPSGFKFGHARVHTPADLPTIVNTYHSSRYNVNTGRLTPAMFDDVFTKIAGVIRDIRAA
jgi:uracil-DNA glycosylase